MLFLQSSQNQLLQLIIYLSFEAHLKPKKQFFQELRQSYLRLCVALEPVMSVKAKEDLATSLVRVLHKQGLAHNFLCDLIMSEVHALGEFFSSAKKCFIEDS